MARRYFGNVRKRASGRYQASYWHDGELHHAPQTFERKADADAYLAWVQADITRGAWLDPAATRLTVDELAERWLTHNSAKRSSTLARDETILRLHVLPALGKSKVTGVDRDRVQRVVNSWQTRSTTRGGVAVGRAVAPRTVRRQYDVLRALFAYAVENGWAMRTPCRGIKLPAAPPLRRPSLTAEQLATLAAELPEPYRAMVWIGVLGLRWGEIAALHVEDVDLEAGRLRVAVQLGRDGERGEPKSEAGRRVLAMPAPLVDLLRDHLKRHELLEPTAYVFQAHDGGPLDYTNWRRRVWLRAAAELPEATAPTVSFCTLIALSSPSLLGCCGASAPRASAGSSPGRPAVPASTRTASGPGTRCGPGWRRA